MTYFYIVLSPITCLFLVQVTAHPHPVFGLSLRVEVLPSAQHSALLDAQTKHNPLSLPSEVGHAPPKNPQSFTVLQLLP